ncbi:MAG: hypothetical protein B7Y40_02985 [Gammaproteobacteria bacterium 28-57-27]|nr:MAG: hypothetical protein B7Y40_02985 [Gammaproteobacteria bacterium 28-57-27]
MDMRIYTQRGMGFVTLFLILSIAGIAAVAGMKIVPLYLDDASVQSAFASLEKQNDPNMGRQEAKAFIQKRLYINQLDEKIPLDSLKVESAPGGGKAITMEYEARATVMGNLDAVAKFTHKAVVR